MELWFSKWILGKNLKEINLGDKGHGARKCSSNAMVKSYSKKDLHFYLDSLAREDSDPVDFGQDGV